MLRWINSFKNSVERNEFSQYGNFEKTKRQILHVLYITVYILGETNCIWKEKRKYCLPHLNSIKAFSQWQDNVSITDFRTAKSNNIMIDILEFCFIKHFKQTNATYD